MGLGLLVLGLSKINGHDRAAILGKERGASKQLNYPWYIHIYICVYRCAIGINQVDLLKPQQRERCTQQVSEYVL